MRKEYNELSLEERIEKAQKKLLKYAGPYREATEELQALYEERNQNRQERLLEAVKKSQRSYEEIMEFVTSDPAEDTWYEPGQGF